MVCNQHFLDRRRVTPKSAKINKTTEKEKTSLNILFLKFIVHVKPLYSYVAQHPCMYIPSVGLENLVNKLFVSALNCLGTKSQQGLLP